MDKPLKLTKKKRNKAINKIRDLVQNKLTDNEIITALQFMKGMANTPFEADSDK